MNKHLTHPIGRRQLAFINYDPINEKTLDPENSIDRRTYPEIPEHLFYTVRRAKKIAGKLSSRQLMAIAADLDVIYRKSHVALSVQFEQQNYNYISAGLANQLKAYLAAGSHNISRSQWSIYFSVLALSLAGEVLNTLYPSQQYNEQIGNEVCLSTHSPDRYIGFASTVAVEALSAVAEAESFASEFVGKREQRKDVSSTGGKARSDRYLPTKSYVIKSYLERYKANPKIKNSEAASHIAAEFRSGLPPELAKLVDNDIYEIRIPETEKNKLKRFAQWIGDYKRGQLIVDLNMFV